MPWGPWPGQVTGGGGAFPGFGIGAPPAVASASAVGASAFASRSDHTHALDILPYNPSTVGMQASGVLQQTYAGPTATPAPLTMTATNIPFGITTGTGVLSQDNRIRYQSTNGRFGVSSTSAVDFTNAAVNGRINIIQEAAGSSFLNLMDVRASSGFLGAQWKKARGTVAAPTIVVAGDYTSTLDFLPYDGATYLNTLSIKTWVPSDAVPAAALVEQMLGVQVASGAVLTVTGPANEAQMAFKVDTAFNVYAGGPAQVAGSTSGYLYLPALAAAPTGVPARLFGSARAANRTPFTFDTADGVGRIYAYNGAWHFAALDDYSATSTRIPYGGATAGTLTDEAAFSYTAAGNVLNVDNVASNAGAGLNLAATGAQALTLQTNGTTRTTISSAGVVTVAGSGAAAPGGTYGNLVWSPATSTLSFGAAGAPPAVGSIFVNTSTGSGQSIGGGVTAGILVRDAGAGGEANIATDTSYFGQQLVGWQSGALTDLNVGVATGQTLRLRYLMDRTVGSGTDALTVDGTTGAIVAGGLSIAATATGALSLDANGNQALGANAALAAGATDGFPYMPMRSGAFTGAPGAFANGAPFAFDRTHQFIQVYDQVGGAWLSAPTFNVVLGAGAGVGLINNLPAGYGVVAKWWGFTTPGGIVCAIPYFTNP